MSTAAARLCFTKMHGAGNDFVVLDLRPGLPPPDAALVRRMADRHRGIGCDQLLAITAPATPGAVAAYRIWNADGSLAGQCGNGARCVAAYLRHDGSVSSADFLLDSPAGVVAVATLDAGHFRIAMGRPGFDPALIPLRLKGEDAGDRIESPWGLLRFGAVSMGNPHAVIEVVDCDHADVAGIGRWMQEQAMFPEGVNVGFVQVLAVDHLRLRVFERGVGETLACGSAACAAVAVLVRQGRIGREVRVDLPGGRLGIDWPDETSPICMSGPTRRVFEGVWIDG